MAPQKTDTPLKADKVTKSQSPSKTARPRKFSNVMNETNFKLLWAYLEKYQTQAPVDHKAAAKRMGMTYAATNQRYYTLRDYFKQISPFDQPGEDDETPAESKTAKSPRKKAVKSPKSPENSKAKKSGLVAPAPAGDDEEEEVKHEEEEDEDPIVALDKQLQRDIAKKDKMGHIEG
ncbi:hypothetical protein N7456_003381 [Penicillium angulare]|uniref:Uncharacterized protein n=1 Tax=Penicillium angulare TaxID=116970 RepID=A0A9W9FUI7_9EURO|nr:hypothetical protein N7456_003381 [Penicillium angulare]